MENLLRLDDYLTRLDSEHKIIHAVQGEYAPTLAARMALEQLRLGDQGCALQLHAPASAALPISLVLNTYSTEARLLRALGIGCADDLSRRVRQALDTLLQPSADWRTAWSALQEPRRQYQDRSAAFPHSLDQSASLALLPAQRNFPAETGSFLTAAVLFARDEANGITHAGIYRIGILGPRTATVHFLPGSDGERIFQRYRQREEPLPVHIALGVPASLLVAAAAPLPPQLDEISFAQWLGGPLPLVSMAGAEIPADAQIVLSGFLHPTEQQRESPFGNHTGYYTEPRPCPVFHLERMWLKARPVCQGIVTGRPPTESHVLGGVVERMLAPLLNHRLPGIVDFRFLPWGMYHGAALILLKPGTDVADILPLLRRLKPFVRSRLLVFVVSHDGLHWPPWQTALAGLDCQRGISLHDGCLVVNATGSASNGRALSTQRQKLLEQMRQKSVEFAFAWHGQQRRIAFCFASSFADARQAVEDSSPLAPDVVVVLSPHHRGGDDTTLFWRALNNVELSQGLCRVGDTLMLNALDTQPPRQPIPLW
ncbi:UbiD family decarboxylase [Desulfurispirillum indicum]|uniref:UbiD family decarboxylase n=1 Tax=Desulfurispirillum indicum TaxID=936456 RepID=UPI0003106B56|nr:UbiD family decarboxylase [Desulfurispirillum indicum]